MKKALRKFLPLLLAGNMLLPLSGCHTNGGRSAFALPESFDESTKQEITFWAKNDTNKTQTAIYKKAISDFEALYPNVTVNLKLYTDYGKIYNDVITNISTGTTPDVCITYPDHIATYLTGSNVVVPLDELMDNASYGLGGSDVKFDSVTKSEIIPEYLEEGRLNDQYYALPYMRSTEALYINRDYVEALGYTVPDIVTWNWIFEVSEAATAKNEDGTYKLNGQNVLIPFIYKSTDNMMISMLKQKGAEYSTDAGEIGIFNDETSSLLKEITEHAKTGAFSTFSISGYPANFLNAGQCVFAIDSTAGSTWMGSDAPLVDIAEDAIVHFTTEVRAIPQFDESNVKMMSQGPSICIFNKQDAQHVTASWLFAQYLLSNDVQTAYAETEGYVPVTSKAQESASYQEYLAAEGIDNTDHYEVKLKATKLLLNNIENTFTTAVFNGSASLRNAAGALIEESVKSARRKQTIDDAYLEQLYSKVSSLYRLDQIERNVAKDAVSARDLGEMPAMSKALLWGLALVWCGIIAWYIVNTAKEKKHKS